MSHRVRIFVVLAFALCLLAPLTPAQKPPAPTPPPSAPPPPQPSGRPVSLSDPNSGPIPSAGELVMFLQGRVATSDSTPVPHDLMVERVCNNKVRQQVYTSPDGSFNMQLGARADTFLDASADPISQSARPGGGSSAGIPRTELRNCELRASGSGFQSDVLNLVGLDAFGGNLNVGVIRVQRTTAIKGATLSALPYQAPKDARRAYEKGLDAERKANLAGARKYFETAVRISPRYTIAWFQLGSVLQKENQKEPARAAFIRATAIDDRFLPPYLSLASMAFLEGNWPVLLALTNHILDLDPLNHTAVTAFIVDLDPVNCADAYYYNAVANFALNKFADAERSALKAERIALPANFPQLHLLLGEIYSQKNDHVAAISELRKYLELAPNAPNEGQVRARLAKLQQIQAPENAGRKPDNM